MISCLSSSSSRVSAVSAIPSRCWLLSSTWPDEWRRRRGMSLCHCAHWSEYCHHLTDIKFILFFLWLRLLHAKQSCNVVTEEEKSCAPSRQFLDGWHELKMSLEILLTILMPDDQLSWANNHENRDKIWNFLPGAALTAYSFNGGHTAFDAVSSQTGDWAQQHRNSRRKLATAYSGDHKTSSLYQDFYGVIYIEFIRLYICCVLFLNTYLQFIACSIYSTDSISWPPLYCLQFPPVARDQRGVSLPWAAAFAWTTAACFPTPMLARTRQLETKITACRDPDPGIQYQYQDAEAVIPHMAFYQEELKWLTNSHQK